MACVSGTNIVNDGLVFHFDLENGVKSFKGKPTSNIINSQTISGVSPLVLTEISNEDGWSKYSISGTWNRGTYPWGMRIGSASLAGGVFHSARMLIKINCRNKFATWVNNGGLHYVNESGMPSAGTRSAISLGYDNDGLEVFEVRNDGFQYSTTYANPTTTQVGYFHSRPLSDGTTFDPQTDFVWVKEIQVEVGEFATKFVNGIRLDTASIIDVSPTQSTITAANLTYRQDDTPTFDGTNDYLRTNFNIQNNLGDGFTFEYWAYHSNISSTWSWPIASDNSNNGQSYAWFQMGKKSGGGDIRFETGGYYTNTALDSINAGMLSNIYYNVVGTVDVLNGVKQIWINGTKNNQVSISKSNVNQDYGDIVIGCHGRNQTSFLENWNGEISQVKIYDKALTDAEVRQNFEATRTRYGI